MELVGRNGEQQPHLGDAPAFPIPFHVLQGVGLDAKPRLVRELTPMGGMNLLVYLAAHAPPPPCEAPYSAEDAAAWSLRWAGAVLRMLEDSPAR